ncbi:tRNA 2-thiouridine(34) synthase MnmA [Thiohalomonas denitrificans]|uniref:tRNA-specific 2-thiouridylase MnmA n=1 Tax=Thiohalomonas denitrificans TaxID=415747 RepID=A0A1G5QBG2_9GAMM|nr:tRNA 2-thiouridine(34) synthase MnmA [Thiohalomonas denitrificans]SCZ59203.1 tRNA-specific 2-thiouridylase [Thiohalomonas denitrificans]
MPHPKHVIVGLSGGVDSSVAALLLQKQGYRVEGLFMKNWEEDDTSDHCTAAEDLADAQAVADALGIRLHAINFSAEYWDRVFTHFLDEFRAGRTPNPDVLCNTEIKFKAFLEHAIDLGADAIATGHYARVRERNGSFQLLKGLDADKDQSYFLHGLNQYQLSRALFPLGELDKGEVRKIAQAAGLVTFAKRDSTGICFIGERDFRTFLKRYLPAQPGDMRTPEGETIGRHEGLMYYTLGQRQGLGIGGVPGYPEAPWFVVDKDLENNILVVAQGHNHPRLLSSALITGPVHWISGETPVMPLPCSARVRYRQSDQSCMVESHSGNSVRASFDVPQRAVTPGQSVVFYAGEICLGGAVIETAFTESRPRD